MEPDEPQTAWQPSPIRRCDACREIGERIAELERASKQENSLPSLRPAFERLGPQLCETYSKLTSDAPGSSTSARRCRTSLARPTAGRSDAMHLASARVLPDIDSGTEDAETDSSPRVQFNTSMPALTAADARRFALIRC